MKTTGLAPMLATVGLAGGILFSAAFARDVRSGISGGARNGTFFASNPARTARFPEGGLVARLAMPRLAVESPVFEGVAAATLARGAGHLPETPLPGDETGNGASVIAIARGGCAGAVTRLKLNDRVRLTTSKGLTRYRVVERRIFEPRTFRLAPPADARVTLITPYPANSPGPAPMRLAVSLEPTAE
jgi:LPXTG-site transpeptidase (sortase) family protein